MATSTGLRGLQRRHPDRRGAVGRDHDRPEELHVLEHRRPVLRAGQRRPGLGHRLHAEHRGEQQVTVEQVIGEVGIAARPTAQRRRPARCRGSARCTCSIKRASGSSRGSSEIVGRPPARPMTTSRRRQSAGWPGSLFSMLDAVIDGDRADALPGQRLKHAQPLAHARACPDRPLERHAAAARVLPWRTAWSRR